MTKDAVGVVIVLAGPLLVVLTVALVTRPTMTGMAARKQSDKQSDTQAQRGSDNVDEMASGDQGDGGTQQTATTIGEVPPAAEAQGGERVDPTTGMFTEAERQARLDAEQQRQQADQQARDRAARQSEQQAQPQADDGQ